MEQKYHIKHIRISSYNSRTNRIVKRSHFNVWQALFKASNGAEGKWSQATYSVFWLERIPPRKRMGCSPYFAVTGTHPLIPLDVVEANYLLPPPDSLRLSTDLIARHAIALQKRQGDLAQLKDHVHTKHNHTAIRFEWEHSATITNYDFSQGDLVLVCNTSIKKALNQKMDARYFRPMIIVSRNKGGAYILCDLDGTLAHAPVATFRVVPYFVWKSLDIPDIQQHIDVTVACLKQMERTPDADPDKVEAVDEALADDDTSDGGEEAELASEEEES